MTYRIRWTVLKETVEITSELMDARFREREEASAYIITLQLKFQQRGYDRMQDKWWANQDEETETRVWTIEADADDQMIADVFKDRPTDASHWQASGAPQKGITAGLRARETDAAARELIGKEKADRNTKTARLRAEREAAEAAGPKTAVKSKKSKR